MYGKTRKFEKLCIFLKATTAFLKIQLEIVPGTTMTRLICGNLAKKPGSVD
jgi:hypothetical protein